MRGMRAHVCDGQSGGPRSEGWPGFVREKKRDNNAIMRTEQRKRAAAATLINRQYFNPKLDLMIP
jgi:hypothetical protein